MNLAIRAGDSKKVPAKSMRRLAKPNFPAVSDGFATHAHAVRKRTANAIHAADSEDNLTSLTLSFVLSSPTGPGRIIEFGMESAT